MSAKSLNRRNIMKRRDFIKTSAAVAASVGLPAAASTATGTPADPFAGTGALITRLRVGNWRTEELREANRHAREAGLPMRHPDPPDDEKNYWAEAIKLGDYYFYRIGETVVPATEYEYRMVIANPNMYYFSSALKLHYRVQRAREGLPPV
jgi:hypothetical protein